jgi:hypothetical protein
MNNLSPNELAAVATMAKELVTAASSAYRTPEDAVRSFENTGKNLTDAGAALTGAVFLAAGRIIRMMLSMNMIAMVEPTAPTSPDPNAN